MYLLELMPELKNGKKARRKSWTNSSIDTDYVIYDTDVDEIMFSCDNHPIKLTQANAISDDWELIEEPKDKKIEKLDVCFHWSSTELAEKINEIIKVLNSREA
ncbi:MAG: hypothetical protein ACYC97_05570 [Metallibacterium sp.]